jgi:hypothetical protein
VLLPAQDSSDLKGKERKTATWPRAYRGCVPAMSTSVLVAALGEVLAVAGSVGGE